jgi:hypothetical protein
MSKLLSARDVECRAGRDELGFGNRLGEVAVGRYRTSHWTGPEPAVCVLLVRVSFGGRGEFF